MVTLEAMRRYGSKTVPKGSSTRLFLMLSTAEKIERVKKLHASNMSVEAIAQLTGLGTLAVTQMLRYP